MKILIVSDTHRHHENLEKVLEQVKPIDLMIHLGDGEGYEDYMETIAECPLYIVAGNNDFFSQLPKERELTIGKHNILLTHGHYDHCARVEDYVKAFGAKVFASKEIEDYLKNGEYNYSEGKFFLSDLSNFEYFMEDDGILKLPHFQIKYKQLGGHSKSDMMYDFNGDLFVGDVLIGRDMGRTDLYGGSREEMSKSLSALKEHDYVTMHSGHGEDFDKKTQDKVASLWLRYLNR